MSVLYIKNQKKIAQLLKDLSTFNNFGKPPSFDKTNAQLNFFANCMFTYALIGVILYTGVQCFLKSQCEALKIEYKLNTTCGFIIPTRLPFKTDYFPMYQVLFIYMFILMLLMTRLALLISCNLLEIAYNVSVRIDHLKTMFSECFKYKNYILSRKNFNRCVSYHWDTVK